MIPVASSVRVWIATGHTDMRCGMNSLALLVQEAFRRDPHGGDLYVLRGKSGKLVQDSLAQRSWHLGNPPNSRDPGIVRTTAISH
jgi:transposase